jgi:hypothetical protein
MAAITPWTQETCHPDRPSTAMELTPWPAARSDRRAGMSECA